MNRNQKCARPIALMMLAFTMGSSVVAQAGAEEPFRLDFQKAHAFSGGDMSQIPYFEACAEVIPPKIGVAQKWKILIMTG